MVYGKISIICAFSGWCFQKAIDWNDFNLKNIALVYLHKCGGITRVEISKDNIKYFEPRQWNEVTEVTHDCCCGCPDVTKGVK